MEHNFSLHQFYSSVYDQIALSAYLQRNYVILAIFHL